MSEERKPPGTPSPPKPPKALTGLQKTWPPPPPPPPPSGRRRRCGASGSRASAAPEQTIGRPPGWRRPVCPAWRPFERGPPDRPAAGFSHTPATPPPHTQRRRRRPRRAGLARALRVPTGTGWAGPSPGIPKSARAIPPACRALPLNPSLPHVTPYPRPLPSPPVLAPCPPTWDRQLVSSSGSGPGTWAEQPAAAAGRRRWKFQMAARGGARRG
jgi:hypothetical protein